MTARRIAILLPDLRVGGAERLSITLAHQFAAMGSIVHFVLMRETGDLLDEARGVGAVTGLGTERAHAVARALPSVIGTFAPDAVIANLWPLTAVAAVSLRRLPKLRRPHLALVEHNPLSIQYAGWSAKTRLALRASQAISCRLADARIAVSRGVAHDVARLALMPERRFCVIHNPVPLPIPDADAIRRAESEWGPRTGRRILTVGTFKTQKNQALALQAFAAMHQPGDRFMLLGDGTQRQPLEERAEALGIADAVLKPGFRSEPFAYYATADLFVLSSDYEGFGNVLVEALGAGLPVVSTDCPTGPREILQDGDFGRLVPINDIDALAEAMSEALVTPGDPAARRARADAFAPNRVAAAYLDVLFPSRSNTGGYRNDGL